MNSRDDEDYHEEKHIKKYKDDKAIGFEYAIECMKKDLKQLCLKKRHNMTADYAWAIEDIHNIIEKISKNQ